MNFILYIKCTEQEDFSYSNSFLEKLRREIPAAEFLDLDNFSDPHLISQAGLALEKAVQSCVLFELHPESNTKPFLHIATWLADHPENSLVFVNGKDAYISKLLPTQEKFCYHELIENEKLLHIQNHFL